ncbi:hypothetical protein BDR05DRAFT_961621 [Suillus weaverae]|nr:hypothetical protein BDR05DRAFT_961621 [Suillus weaverae]
MSICALTSRHHSPIIPQTCILVLCLISLSNYHVDTCAWMHPIFGCIELWNAFNTATCWPRLSSCRGYGAR